MGLPELSWIALVHFPAHGYDGAESPEPVSMPRLAGSESGGWALAVEYMQAVDVMIGSRVAHQLKGATVTALAALSLLLALGIVCMWAMSYRYFDMIHTTTPGRIFDIESCAGEVQVVLTYHEEAAFNPRRRIGLWTREPRDGNYISRYIGHYESAYDFLVGDFGVGWNNIAASAPRQHHYRLLLPYRLLAALSAVLPASWFYGCLRGRSKAKQADGQQDAAAAAALRRH